MANTELKQLEREIEVAAAHFAMAGQQRIHLSEADQRQSASVSEARVVSAAINAMDRETDVPVEQLLVESVDHPNLGSADQRQWKAFLARVRDQVRGERFEVDQPPGPVVDSQAIDSQVTGDQATDSPATDSPATDSPATDSPATDSHATGSHAIWAGHEQTINWPGEVTSSDQLDPTLDEMGTVERLVDAVDELDTAERLAATLDEMERAEPLVVTAGEMNSVERLVAAVDHAGRSDRSSRHDGVEPQAAFGATSLLASPPDAEQMPTQFWDESLVSGEPDPDPAKSPALASTTGMALAAEAAPRPATMPSGRRRRSWRLRASVVAVLMFIGLGSATLVLTRGNWTTAGDEKCDGGDCPSSTEANGEELAITPTTPPRPVSGTESGDDTSPDATTSQDAEDADATVGEPEPEAEPEAEPEPEADAGTATSTEAPAPAPADSAVPPADVRATTPVSAPEVSAPAPTPAPTTTAPAPTTTTTTASTTTEPPNAGGVPCPGGGAVAQLLSVTRVASNDVLNIRTGPGTSFDVVVSLASNATGVQTYQTSASGSWVMVRVPGAGPSQSSTGCGWVHSYYLV